MRFRALLAAAVCLATAAAARAATLPPQPTLPLAAALRLVVIVTRHGIRSPTNPDELKPYVAYPMASWNVAPGELTAHGATMTEHLGASYRAQYANQIVTASGCPKRDDVYVWSDVDQRTKASGAALLAGFAPDCGLKANASDAATDPLFHALPALGKADPVLSSAAVGFATGDDSAAIVRAHSTAFAKLDAILACKNGGCTPIASVPNEVKVSVKSGLANVGGAVDIASTAVEDFILAYADGKPFAQIGNGSVDRETLLQLSELHTLKFALNTEPPYVARVQGSNLLSHVVATIDQGALGRRLPGTRAPVGARFVAFVGHDTNLEEFAGMLGLRWLLDGYQPNDTPPGGALVFEVYEAAGGSPFVRTYFEAQSLDQMRELSSGPPARVPVFIPGCPSMDCPLPVFDAVTAAAIDPAYVSTW